MVKEPKAILLPRKHTDTAMYLKKCSVSLIIRENTNQNYNEEVPSWLSG